MFTKLCDCERMPCYNGNESCSLCLSEQAKKERSKQCQTEKQAKTLAKAKERQREPKQPVKQVSRKQQQEQAELSRIKKDLIDKGGRCIACNTSYDLTLSHVISRRHKQFVTDPKNLVLLCIECHQLYEFDRSYFALLYPTAWKIKLERAKRLSTEHFYKLLNQEK